MIDKAERMFQIYSWYKTAHLNVLYYKESLRNWTLAVRVHDVLIALSGASSPIAFWQHSVQPVYKQYWFYLTLFAAASAALKPILRWENELRLFTELHTHYFDLYMDLKYLVEDITVARELSTKSNSVFEHYRGRFKELEKKEPLPVQVRIKKLELQVNQDIDINKCWFPPEEEGPI